MTDRMRDVSHAPPDVDPAERTWFRRGPAPVADGGRAGEGDPAETGERAGESDPAGKGDPAEGDRDVEAESMGDVAHTPAHGDGAERVWDGTRVRPREDDDE